MGARPYVQVIEFGAGDGTPVINCLLKTHFNGHIHGYELNPSSHEVASGRIQQVGALAQPPGSASLACQHSGHCVWQPLQCLYGSGACMPACGGLAAQEVVHVKCVACITCMTMAATCG